MKREFPEMPIAAAAAVIVREKRILIIRRGFPPNEKKWSIPGGVIEIGEPAREAAMREVREETGLSVRVDSIVDVVDNIIYEEGRVKYHFINCDFHATYLSGEVATNEEVLDFAWIGEEDLKGYDLTTGAAHVIRKVFAKHGEKRD